MFNLLFTKTPERTQVLKSLKLCHCGNSEYKPLRGDDAVYCTQCGTFYLIYFVSDPRAKYDYV